MVKIVEKGFRDCTVTLDGSECAVEFPANYRVFSAQNMSDSDIVMSVESGKTAEDDGVRIVEAGGCGMLAHMRSDINTVYITGTGKVHISAGNEAVLPFKVAAKGGESINAEASGNPVELSGLQGGVPFAEIAVSGGDIVGQELTVSVSGKNLIPYPYYDGVSKTLNGVTFTINADGSVTVNGTATANTNLWLYPYGKDYMHLNEDVSYFLSGNCCTSGEVTISLGFYSGSTWIKAENDKGNGKSFQISHSTNYDSIGLSIFVEKNAVCDYITVYPQLEIGSTVTPYEPYHGSVITITPDTNPYTIPNDIRQQDGYNVISVSEGELSVAGVRKNAAIKRIWDDMGMDLLFDGLARSDSPAVGLDFSGYSKFVVSNYYYVNKIDYSGTVLIEIDRLETLINDAGAMDIPISTQYSVLNYFSGSISDASFYAVQSADASALYATRIYGIR